MNVTARTRALVLLVFGGAFFSSGAQAQNPLVKKWIDGWNSSTPQILVSDFTPDGYYEDVPSGLSKTGSKGISDLHKEFHELIGGLNLKLVAAHIERDHGTIEWILGGTDNGMWKTGKAFSVPGVSVIEVKNGRISRDLDYYDVATIMKQVGVLPNQ
jgi:steroid delta-isomerase-like uncharacterized protein